MATFENSPKTLAAYPHVRKVGNLLFISGISSRKLDNTIEGAEFVDGSWKLDIRSQTRGVIKNIETMLKNSGGSLSNLVDVTVFLTDMKDYVSFNEVYNEYFKAETGPTRTTVAVKQLPLPNLLIEIKGIAAF